MQTRGAILRQAPGKYEVADLEVTGDWRLVRRTLGLRAFGLNLVDIPPGGQIPEHDETGRDQEEVFYVVSGSPTQMRQVLAAKLALDGIEYEEFVLMNNLKNIFRGRFRATSPRHGRYCAGAPQVECAVTTVMDCHHSNSAAAALNHTPGRARWKLPTLTSTMAARCCDLRVGASACITRPF